MRKLIISLVVAVSFGLVGGAVIANEATIKYRQGHLAAMGGHTNAVFQLFGETAIPPERMASHARALVTLVNELEADLEGMFPAGSGEGKTDALPKIWADWDGFTEAAAKAKSAADDVTAALDANDNAAFGSAMKAMGGACKGCHKKFRAE
ncbi:MAG: c-type cytochrome [Gammaproteobacteria bacterium]